MAIKNSPWIPWLLAGVSAFLVFIHLALPAPGVDAGLHLYGSYLLTKGLFPYTHLWNNKPFLIYVIGLPGFAVHNNPFLGERILELGVLGLDCWLLAGAARALQLKRPLLFVAVFLVLYLLCWDQGFLTETFVLPLTLWYARAYARKSRHRVWIGALALLLATLLKQNGAVVIAGMAVIDLSNGPRRLRRLAAFGGILLTGVALTWLLLHALGLDRDFLDQVFTYNAESVHRPGPWRWVRVQLRGNGFLSYRGISLQLLLDAWMVVLVARYCLRRPVPPHLAAAAAIYLLAFPLVYLSGKTYAHYFILLLIPATVVLGDLAERFRAARLTLTALLAWGIIVCCGAIPGNRKVYRDMRAVAQRVRSTTSPEQPIDLAGFGNQYVYVLSDRLCNTRFLLPLLEGTGYSPTYRYILDTDFARHPPAVILLNKNNYRGLDPGNYYTQLITARLPDYQLLTENESFMVFSAKVPLESTSKVP